MVWFEEQVDQAEQAAAKHDLRTVYAVVNTLAPRRRAEKVRIRSSQGHLLTVKQEFRERMLSVGVTISECPLLSLCCASPRRKSLVP